MSQSSVDEKTVKIIKFPCTTINHCLENDEDYDPCANGQDITDDDLEIISKIQVATRKTEATIQTTEKGKQQYNEKATIQTTEKGKQQYNEKATIQTTEKGKQQYNEVEQDKESGKEKWKKDSKQEGRVNADSGIKTVHGGDVDNDDDDDDDDAHAPTVRLIRKICLKRVKKNPFHRDRLALPSCKSPPPRLPPPQFYPPANEEIECPKRKKSKPCKKKTGIEENKTKSKDESKSEVNEGKKESTRRDETDGKGGKSWDEFLPETNEYNPDTNGYEPDTNESSLDTNGETSDTSQEKVSSVTDRKSKRSVEFDSKNRKPCMRRREQKPCKKKVSEISISLLPPSIPPLQRNLPSISPKDIPEVRRQALMAEESMRTMNRKHCKGRSTNKTKNKLELV